MPRVIGITGGIASGKSTVSNLIKDMGYLVISADQISHQVLNDKRLKAGYKKIVLEFGEQILDENKNIDRKKLGAIVFDDKEKRTLLENILHPIIKERIKEKIEKSTNDIIFVEVPLLFETDFIDLVDETIVVYTDLDHQIWRQMARDKVDFPTAIKKIYTQMPMDEKLERATYIIDNCHQIEDLPWQVKQLMNKITGGQIYGLL